MSQFIFLIFSTLKMINIVQRILINYLITISSIHKRGNFKRVYLGQSYEQLYKQRK